MTIIHYRNCSDIDIQFSDGTIANTTYYYFLKGSVPNYNIPSYLGIGYLGYGKYKSRKNNIKTEEYIKWGSMLTRCYSEKLKERRNYIECTVCDEWHNFQNFAEWYNDHKYYLPDVDVLDLDKDIKIKITSPIKRLHHQDYDGKRVFIDISDNFGNVFSTKLDVGVHKDIDIDQDELCFDLGIDSNSVTLLANSKEQICVEKIKSLLKFGITSTRYKDIFDIYYLINKSDFEKRRFLNYLDKLIFRNELVEESNITELLNSLKYTLSNKKFKSMVNMAKNNWLELSIDDTVNSILDFISSLELVEV